MVEARTLQFQQEQIATGNIPQGRVEQTIQAQRQKERQYQIQKKAYDNQVMANQQAIASNLREQEAYRNAVKAWEKGVSYYWYKGQPEYKYLKELWKTQGAFKLQEPTNKDTVMVNNQGVSVAQELQEDYVTKQTSRGYKVETWNKIYTPVKIEQTKPIDQVTFGEDTYSVRREKQAPFILDKLARQEQVRIKQEKEYAQEVINKVQPKNSLLMNKQVRGINKFVGEKLNTGYDIFKTEGTKSYNILKGKVESRRAKSDYYTKTQKAKEEKDILYSARREKLKEKTGLDLELFGKEVASPFGTSVSGIGKAFPKVKEVTGKYFEENPEQGLFAKGAVIAGDWLAVGKMFPTSKGLPKEFKIKKTAPIKTKPEFSVEGITDDTIQFKSTKKIPRRYAYYTSPKQEGGLIFGKPVKKTYTPPKTIERTGSIKYNYGDDESFKITGDVVSRQVGSKKQVGTLIFGEGKKMPLDLEKQLTEKQKSALLGKQYAKQGKGYKAGLLAEDVEYAKASITGIDVTKLSYKKTPRKLNLYFKDVKSGRRTSRADVKVLQRRLGEGTLGESYGFRSIGEDTTYPRFRKEPKRYEVSQGVSIIPKKAEEGTDIISGMLRQASKKRPVVLEGFAQQINKMDIAKSLKPKPQVKAKVDTIKTPGSQILTRQSNSLYYGKGTYERTESAQVPNILQRQTGGLRPAISNNFKVQSRELTSEVNRVELRTGLRTNSALNEALRSLSVQREALRQTQQQKQALRTSQKFKLGLGTRVNTPITPRLSPPNRPTKRNRIIKQFKFKIESKGKLPSIFNKRKESSNKYSPSYSALSLNIRSKKKPAKTKGGYFFGFRPILD